MASGLGSNWSGAYFPIGSTTVRLLANSTSRAAKVPTSGTGSSSGRPFSSKPFTLLSLRYLTPMIRSVRLGRDDLYLNIDTGVGVLYVVSGSRFTRTSLGMQLWAGTGASVPQISVWNRVQTSRPYPRAS